MPIQLVARDDAGFEILEGPLLRLGADVLARRVFAHPKLQERRVADREPRKVKT